MSKISLAPDVAGTGIFTIASPNSNTNRTLTLPDDTGTIVTNSGNQAGSFTTLNTSGAVVFNDAGADVDFRVESDTDENAFFLDGATGNVGIGKIPGTKILDVAGEGQSGANNVDITWSTTSSGYAPTVNLKKSNGSKASPTVVASGDQVGVLLFAGYDGSNYISTAYIESRVDGTPGTNDMPGRLVFFTTADSSASPTERARFTSSGYFKASPNATYNDLSGPYHELNQNSTNNISVGSFNSSASPYGYLFETTADPNNGTNYGFRYSANGGAVGVYTIYSNGTVAARSDAKWKKNIETTRDGYAEDLARLRVVKYNWYNHEDGTPKELGLIAQEVEEVFPGLVLTEEEIRRELRTREVEKTRIVTEAVLDEDGNEVEPAVTETYTEEEEYTEKVATGEYTKSIKFSVFVPMLIKAVQELKAITDTQAQTISALEARIAALETGA